MALVEIACPVCGTPYKASPYRLSIGKNSTCSRGCSYILRGQKCTVDLAGTPFGLLTVLGLGKKRGSQGETYWNCICKCGKMKEISRTALKSGYTKSCGWDCPLRERVSEDRYESRRLWLGMKNRCYNLKSAAYGDYGARGITICERWLVFENFFSDMGVRPSRKHTIERKNNNLGYSPENCIWLPKSEQSNNTRRTLRITHDGRTMNAKQWANETGIPYCTIVYRFKAGLATHLIFSREPLFATSRFKEGARAAALLRWHGNV